MGVRVADRRLTLALLALLSALAWLGLWLWGQSPYGRFLDHDGLAHISLTAGQGEALLAPLLFVAGWVVMTVAMMLPTSLPLIALFHAITRRRSDQMRLVGLLIAGYLAIWTTFGLVIHLGDWGLHQLVQRSGWLGQRAWLISAAILAVAGIYQFTPLKYHCLDKCRSPLSFIMAHWRGRRERLQAWRLGISHGLFCVGCCWSLMLLMFAVGVGSLGWMLVLGAVMAAEKNLSWGRRLSAPLGGALLVWAVALLWLNLAAPAVVPFPSIQPHAH
jgi:predicted metal-binding membrane protein